MVMDDKINHGKNFDNLFKKKYVKVNFGNSTKKMIFYTITKRVTYEEDCASD